MAIYNSQKRNNDPMPWHEWETGTRYSGEEVRAKNARGETWYGLALDPRPEFDNNPNPLLVEVRKCEQATGDQWGRSMMLDALTSDTRAPEIFREAVRESRPEHIAHARKVRARLAALA